MVTLQSNSARPRFLDKSLAILYGKELLDMVKITEILIAGVGGIGCELLKSLIQAGFEKLTIVDFDVIDKSNLNRQIYFRQGDVSQKLTKVDAVYKNILTQYPHIQMKAYCSDIRSLEPYFFSPFHIVLCAVDNIESRIYLSRMCTIMDKPMFEGGSRSLSGQTKMQKRGLFQCNQCRPSNFKEEVVACSIRAIPTDPVHAIIWAKELFQRIFINLENKQIVQVLEEPKHPRSSTNGTIKQLRESIFNQYFNDDVKAYIVESLKNQKKVFPIDYKQHYLLKEPTISLNQSSLKSQNLWSITECIVNFMDSASVFINELLSKPKNEIIFDKDNSDCMKFVCAATNLRIYNFLDPDDTTTKLKYVSLFDTKDKIGNIIPTVSSANSIIAGLQVMEILKYLKGQYQELRAVWSSITSKETLDYNRMKMPSLECQVCSYKNIYIHLSIRSDTTLGHFINFISNYYCVIKPQILLSEKVIYDLNDDDEDMIEIYKKNLNVTLTKLLNREKIARKGSMVVTSPIADSSALHFYFIIKEDLNEKIAPNSQSERSVFIEQQKIYMQQVSCERNEKITKLSRKYYFDN